MTDIHTVLQCLVALGIEGAEPEDDGSWLAQTGLTQLRVHQHAQHLRIEALIIPQVARNKVALWQVMHLNNDTLPFGQFYITPDNYIAFGLTLDSEGYYMPWLAHIISAVVQMGGLYYKKLSQDFHTCPFDERDMRANLTHLARSEYAVQGDENLLSKDAASMLLARVLAEVVGDDQLVKINNYEFGLSLPEQVLSISLEQMPAQRRSKLGPDWCLRVSSEVGVIESTDDKLWVRLNRLNYHSNMLAYAIRHNGRKPLVHLQTEVHPVLLPHAQLWQDVVAAHTQAASTLVQSLHSSYRLQSMVHYKLGL